MKRRIVVAILVIGLLLGLFVVASALTIDGYTGTLLCQIDLPTTAPTNGGFYSKGFVFSWSSEPSSTLNWTVTPTDGGPALTITPEGTGKDSKRAWLNLDPTVTYTVDGTAYHYTIAAGFPNGTPTSTTVSIIFNKAALPGGYSITAAKMLTSSSLDAAVPVNGEMNMVRGERYVYTETVGTNDVLSSYSVSTPDTMGSEWDQEFAFDYPNLNLNQSNQQIFKARNNGTYSHCFIAQYTASNVACYMPYTLRISEQSASQPLSIQAAYQQAHPQAGSTLDLDWSVSGGTAPYTVQVAWQAQESCLQKVMRTDTFTTSSGTASYTLPNTSIDQVEAIVTVTDSTGATQSNWFHTNLEGWDHGHNVVAGDGIVNDQDYAYVGDTISGRWQIDPGKYTISNVRYRWIVVTQGNNGSNWEYGDWVSAGNNLTGNASLKTTKAGNTYLSIAFDANDGWSSPGMTFDPIQVLNPGDAPLVPEISITTNKAEPGEPITIEWNVSGAGTNHYIWIEWTYMPNSGSNFHDVRDHAATSGSVTYTPTEKGGLSAWVHATNYDTGAQINKNAYLTVGGQPGPGPGNNISIQASYTQPNHPAGQQIDLDWSVSGGTAPYTVQIDWKAHESCLQKVLKTETITASSGTASFTPPSNTIDQVETIITVTDSTGAKQEQWYWAGIQGWDHGHNIVASDSIENGQDYAYVGDTISGSWSIDPGKYTISNVRYRWIVVTQGNNGSNWEYGDWVSAGNNLTGNASLKTIKAGNTYLSIAFDASDGWSESGVTFEPIQVLNSGEVPLTAEISLTPEKPKTGENITLAWNVGGATANTDIEVRWNYNTNNGNGSSDSFSPTAATGSTTLNFNDEGWLNAEVRVRDQDRDIQFSRYVSTSVREPSGLILTVSPANPQLGQEVTVSWEITRSSYDDAGLDIELYAANLSKYQKGLNGAEKIRTEKKGSATFTPTEGDSFKVFGRIWTNDNYFEEELGPIPLTGSWNAPNPLNVNVTYTVQQTRSVAGPRIIADYTITGGTENISYIDAYWYRYDADGRIMSLHERSLGDNASGQLIYTPAQNGDYALVLQVGEQNDWYYYQEPSMVTNKVTITNAAQTALGIDVFEGLPELIDLDGDYRFYWDVTGGDASDERQTQIFMTTDDGIVLEHYTDYGFTSYGQIPIAEIGLNSRYVIIELTPSDGTTTGDTVRFEIPISRNGRLILPRNLTRIESEAFLNTAATEIDIPDGVTEIGENAFPEGITLILGTEQWWNWAETNGYNPVSRGE